MSSSSASTCVSRDQDARRRRRPRDTDPCQLSLGLTAETSQPGGELLPTPEHQARILHRRSLASGAIHTDVSPGNEYPTTLTRLPLFPPTRVSKRREADKERVWTPLPSSWSGDLVEKSGPALSTVDEDTLIAMIQVRSGRYLGAADAMPIPTLPPAPPAPRIEAGFGGDADVLLTSPTTCSCFVSVFSLDLLETWIRGYRPPRGWGGKDLRLRAESISRLSAVLLRFSTDVNELFRMGRGPFMLFRAQELRSKTSVAASYYIQWEPLLSRQLESYRTFLDIGVRRNLTPLGKAIHRFLSSQCRAGTYAVGLDVLFEAIGATGREAQLKYYSAEQIDKMIACGFLTSGKIERKRGGSGWVCEVEFSTKSASSAVQPKLSALRALTR